MPVFQALAGFRTTDGMLNMATISDVAKAANVSITSVSSILSGGASNVRVGADARARIVRAAQDLQYRRNPVAAALATGRKRLIGVCFRNDLMDTTLTHPHGALWYAHMLRAAAEAAYAVTTIPVRDELLIDERVVDGLIVLTSQSPEGWRALARASGQVPVISLQRPEGVEDVIHWVPHQRNRERQIHLVAADYLYKLGHRRIAILDFEGTGCPALGIFRKAAEDCGLDVDLSEIFDRFEERRYPNVDRLLDLTPTPTAIYAFDDDVSRYVIQVLAGAGMRVPHNVSVLSRETHATAQPSRPALTGIDSSVEHESAALVKQFIRVLQKDIALKDVALPSFQSRLIERESCRAAGAAS